MLLSWYHPPGSVALVGGNELRLPQQAASQDRHCTYPVALVGGTELRMPRQAASQDRHCTNPASEDRHCNCPEQRPRVAKPLYD